MLNRRYIFTRQGETILVCVRDYDALIEHSWHIDSSGYARATISKNICLMHRVVMGESAGKCVDHINGNKLDNRRENLRPCSHSENCRNRKRNVNNKSGFKGVRLHRKSRLYQARIAANGSQISLGYYKTPQEAFEAYKQAAVKYYGSFARFSMRKAYRGVA